MDALKETRDKLKKVAACWRDIKDVEKDAVYDINDPFVKWDKKLAFEDVKDVVEERVNLSKPTLKEIKQFKEPVGVSAIGLVLVILGCMVLFGISAQYFGMFCGPLPRTLLPYLFFFGGTAMFTTGICFLIANSNYKKIDNTFSQTTKGKVYSALGVLLVICGFGMFFTACSFMNISSMLVGFDENYGLSNATFNLMITYIVEVVSLLLNCVGVCLLVNAKTSFNLRMAKFKEKTKDNEENLKYNTEQYPKDVAAFEKQYKVMCDEEVKKINAAHKFINDNFAKIEQIDIVSFTQAKYAQYLLDNIYRGAESIKEAFAMLDSNMDKIEYKPATTVKTTATKDAQTKGKKGWARLSKLAKAMIIVPIITVGLPILWWIVAAILQNNPDTLVFVVGTGLIIGFVSYGLIGATAVFESIGAAILIYRKIKKDWKK